MPQTKKKRMTYWKELRSADCGLPFWINIHNGDIKKEKPSGDYEYIIDKSFDYGFHATGEPRKPESEEKPKENPKEKPKEKPKQNVPKNDYDVLEIPQGTKSCSVIRKAYRTLALKHHPDKGGKAEKFRSVQEAYERLIQTCVKMGGTKGRMGGTKGRTKGRTRRV
jgi:hypothetical protein